MVFWIKILLDSLKQRDFVAIGFTPCVN